MTMETVGAIRRDQGRTISAATSSPTRERASVKPIRDRFGSRSPNCAVLKEQPQRAPTWPRDVPILLRTVAARLEDADARVRRFCSAPRYGGAFRVIRAHQSIRICR
jgi:hypothetical protein